MATVALTRGIVPAMAQCELTHLEQVQIDVDRAAAQHEDYERALTALGAPCAGWRRARTCPTPCSSKTRQSLSTGSPSSPVPGVASRRGECDGVAAALAVYRPLAYIAAPGTLDGGDVLVVREVDFIGLSSRTNAAAIESGASACRSDRLYRARCHSQRLPALEVGGRCRPR